MMTYLIEASLLLLGFATVFHFLLDGDNAYQFHRWYLVGSLLASLVIPLIVWPRPIIIETANYQLLPHVFPLENAESQVSESLGQLNFMSIVFTVLFCAFWLGVIYKAFLFGRQLYGLLANIRRGELVKGNGYKLVLLPGQVPIHSFGLYVFAGRADYQAGKVEAELIQHELAHIQQRHTWDILTVELIHIFFWFHPILKYFRTAIKLNHEHLSDQAVVKEGVDVIYYQQLLLKNICTYQTNPLASPLHFSFTKKRFQMMPKHLMATEGRHKRWLILPFIALFLMLSNINLTGQEEIQEIPPPPPPVKKEAFDRPPPPPPVRAFVEKRPTVQQLQDWQNEGEYGVWFDGKRMDNAQLKQMQPADFGWFSVSRLLKNAVNYGKHTYQVDVFSKAYFEKNLKNRKPVPFTKPKPKQVNAKKEPVPVKKEKPLPVIREVKSN
ncbi:MAG: hypothetical protein KTR30_31550 [Saprospiraceae bacterium]|nr:hypothetical protein [Saprospiraceae bacterium]